MKQKGRKVPASVLRRIALYLQHVRELRKQDQKWVSSYELAEALDLGSSSVRQDLSCLDITGTANRGYETDAMEKALVSFLGQDQTYNMIIVGAGNLGRALALHEEFRRQGFEVCGVVDSDARVVGRKVGKLVVRPMAEVSEVVQEVGAHIGVIAVPADAAQEVANQLVEAGVQGLLNMSSKHVQIPGDVPVVAPRLFASLSLLSYAIKEGRSTGTKEDGSCPAT